ncbi:hypothetical protein SAMN05421686_10731 [Thalassolituus maritimus]|jgi:hypothetical protein|uniref:Uncharacterized protein n=1 Tax=Thalassolituus maritimus TaxID=484498 RepID=A0A1N7NI11_9GAMM|nr:hypothetical protein [Thalassolituus maritimus]SIS97976.1 hypothetical protein SAMN05421686_10731 [Thalassolituus maritimus]
MPLLLLIGAGALGVGAGTKMAGSGLNEAGNGSIKIAMAVTIGAALFMYYSGAVKK